jgi:hypothetical protein
MRVPHAYCGMDDSRHEPRVRNRDVGLARLRRATRVTLFGATALAGAFAGLAARSTPGHEAGAAAATTTQAQTRTQTETQSTTQAPAQKQVATPPPTTTAAPPVAVTGTS